MSRRKTVKPKANIGSRIASLFFGTVLVAGLCLLSYPAIANWWNQLHQSKAVAAYVAQTKDHSKQERKVMLAQARQYNTLLAKRALLSKTENENDRWVMAADEKQRYDSTLDINGSGVMGYVTIPSIKVRLPIYHGTDEGILQIATGHIAGSSLPVGGPDTHAVISGHTGLPSAKLFTGLDKLKKATPSPSTCSTRPTHTKWTASQRSYQKTSRNSTLNPARTTRPSSPARHTA